MNGIDQRNVSIKERVVAHGVPRRASRWNARTLADRGTHIDLLHESFNVRALVVSEKGEEECGLHVFLCATARVAGSPSRCFVCDQTHGCVRRRRWRRAQRKSHVFFYAPQREWQEARVAVLISSVVDCAARCRSDWSRP
jgi:hypothetical protein